MTKKRKQSLTDAQIIKRGGDDKFGAAGAPNMEGFSYRTDLGSGLGDGDISEPVLTLEAPRNLAVVSKVLSFAPDGSQIVTVVIEFDEVEGAEGYESRVSVI